MVEKTVALKVDLKVGLMVVRMVALTADARAVQKAV